MLDSPYIGDLINIESGIKKKTNKEEFHNQSQQEQEKLTLKELREKRKGNSKIKKSFERISTQQ